MRKASYGRSPEEWRALALLASGASPRVVAQTLGLTDRAVRGWLERGRRALPDARFEVLVAVVYEAQRRVAEVAADRELEPGELRRLVSRAARAGDVRAMKLAVELGVGVEGSSRDELEELLGTDAESEGKGSRSRRRR